jgi:hypothetical protein
VLEEEDVIFEQMGKEALSYSIDLYKFEIDLVSQGYNYGVYASIIIDGEEQLDTSRRGLSVVVLDKEKREVTQAFTLDLYQGRNRIYRYQ